MALIHKGGCLRNASVRAATHVSVAYLTRDDFKLICTMYPEFDKKIREMAYKRVADNEEAHRRASDAKNH